MSPRVAVIVPTHDRPDCLRRLVEALIAQSHRPAQILIVNDAEMPIDEGLLSDARAVGIEPREIRLSTPSSAASRNAGLAEAEGDIMLCLDDDMIPETDFIETLCGWYEADTDGRVDGIGVPYAESGVGLRWRAWQYVATLLGRVKWGPRTVRARYVPLSRGLAAQLQPARMLPGGAMSMRSRVARVARFDETFGGYAFGEDRELSYRLTQRYALFIARRLRIRHDPPETGRGDWRERGRAYVRNMVHVARRATEGGAGTWALLGYDLFGTFLQHALWPGRGGNRRFAAGMLGEGFEMLRRKLGDAICGY
jgi:glycosyltransferase involved in cell wall biosynthesis